MIYCLTGKILKKTLDTVVISCAGGRLRGPGAHHHGRGPARRGPRSHAVHRAFGERKRRRPLRLCQRGPARLLQAADLGFGRRPPRPGWRSCPSSRRKKSRWRRPPATTRRSQRRPASAPSSRSASRSNSRTRSAKGWPPEPALPPQARPPRPRPAPPPRRWPRWSASATRRRRLRWPSPVSTIRCRCRTSSRLPCAGCPMPGAEPPAALHP